MVLRPASAACGLVCAELELSPHSHGVLCPKQGGATLNELLFMAADSCHQLSEKNTSRKPRTVMPPGNLKASNSELPGAEAETCTLEVKLTC